MKRVLLVSCEGLGNGGVQAVIMSIVRNLHKEYLFDILLFTSEKRYYDEEFLTYGGQIFRIPRYEGENRFRKKIDYYVRGRNLYNDVCKLLKEKGPFDVIHCNDEFENAPILKAAAECGVPIRISHTHIVSRKSNILADMIEKNRKKTIENYATVKIGCSVEACKSFYADSTNAFVVNNAYDDRRFDKQRYVNNTEPGLSLLQVGSFNDTKNQLFTIEVLAQIKNQIQNVHLSFVGFDMNGYKDKMVEKIKQLNLESCVSFYPSNADIPQLLMNSSFFVFPSKHEGFGIVLIEAQAMGKKCFAADSVPATTDCGGVIFLTLSDGPKVWAKRIIEEYEGENSENTDYDVSAFASSKVMDGYRKIYGGEV